MAGYPTATLNAMVNAIAAAGAYISAHTADPGTTGTSEATYSSGNRPQTTWGAAAGGSRAGSQVAANITGGQAITHWGIWSAATGGTWVGGFALSATETFGVNGVLNHTPTISATN